MSQSFEEVKSSDILLALIKAQFYGTFWVVYIYLLKIYLFDGFFGSVHDQFLYILLPFLALVVAMVIAAFSYLFAFPATLIGFFISRMLVAKEIYNPVIWVICAAVLGVCLSISVVFILKIIVITIDHFAITSLYGLCGAVTGYFMWRELKYIAVSN